MRLSRYMRGFSRTALWMMGFFALGSGLHAFPQTGSPSSSLVELPAIDEVESHEPLSIDIMSDTQSVDFSPYMTQLIHVVLNSWKSTAAHEPAVSAAAKGVTGIRFRVNADGKVTSMRLDRSSGNAILDRTAWMSVQQLKAFSPLPKAFTGSGLDLSLHFNPSAGNL
jgi:TonB family protein